MCIIKSNILHTYMTQIVLQDISVPPTECDNATTEFFAVNNECGRAFLRLSGGNESAIVSLYDGNCPMQLNDYATACSDVYGDEVNMIPRLLFTPDDTYLHNS